MSHSVEKEKLKKTFNNLLELFIHNVVIYEQYLERKEQEPSELETKLHEINERLTKLEIVTQKTKSEQEVKRTIRKQLRQELIRVPQKHDRKEETRHESGKNSFC